MVGISPKKLISMMIAGSMMAPLKLMAAPFDACTDQAFLVQGEVATMYGVNLKTGEYEVLAANLGTTHKINGIGYNVHDDYLYGYGYEAGTLVRIGDDFVANPIAVTNFPSQNFYVGDVSPLENTCLLYTSDAADD